MGATLKPRKWLDINGDEIRTGMFVRHTTSNTVGVVHDIRDYGDIVIKFPNSPLPLTTRGCYLEVL